MRQVRSQDGMLAMPASIPEIVSYELGVDLKLAGGQSHPGGKNRAVCWTATFNDIPAYEVYEKHAAHLKVITELIKPIMEPGTRAAVQYEFAAKL